MKGKQNINNINRLYYFNTLKFVVLFLLTLNFILGCETQGIPSGNYSGSQKMGYASGSASLIINGSSCTYSYNMGSFGSATEKGKFIKEGGEWKLDCQSSGGGKYPIKYYPDSGKVVISGYNSEAVLYQQK
ncbi:MAG: hypothetical protein H8D45_14065 [Bacteroidetes bacterium]|nr:hypothetical protein [Bacteroidota bacterium]